MDAFMAARMQMGVSLGFHIIFACIGMVMPWFMFMAEWKWIKTNNPVYLDLAKAWSKRSSNIFCGLEQFQERCYLSNSACCGQPLWNMQARFSECLFRWKELLFFVEAIALGFIPVWMEPPKQKGSLIYWYDCRNFRSFVWNICSFCQCMDECPCRIRLDRWAGI